MCGASNPLLARCFQSDSGKNWASGSRSQSTERCSPWASSSKQERSTSVCSQTGSRAGSTASTRYRRLRTFTTWPSDSRGLPFRLAPTAKPIQISQSFIAAIHRLQDSLFIETQQEQGSVEFSLRAPLSRHHKIRLQSVNNTGQIVGIYDDLAGRHGFLRSNGIFKTLDPPTVLNRFSTEASAINDLGQIVGSYLACESCPSPLRGFVSSGGVFTDIIHPAAGPGGITSPQGINNAGQIVGSYIGPAGVYRGFMLSAGVFTAIDFPGATNTFVNGINNAGVIVGGYDNGPSTHRHGFLLRAGAFTLIDLPGSSYTEARSINDSGQIVGDYADSLGSYSHGFFSSGGSFSPVDFPGASNNEASGINNAGQIVGLYSGGVHGFLAQAAPAVTTPAALPTGTTGSFYSQTLAASGGTAPYTWSTISGSLPLGLTVSSAGAITGTPTSPGTSSFTVRVTDSVGSSMTQAFALTINQQSTGLTILTTSALPSGTVGVAYSQGFSATGGSTPYKGWVLASGTLPPGTSLTTGVLAGTELLSGNPTAAGSF